MALNLAVKEGSAVYIDDEPLRVVTVTPPLIGTLPNSIFLKSKEGLLNAVELTGQAFKDAQEKKGK